jgi:sugar transferase (PEP-CTERM/EpsH1 system associated)
MRLLVLSSRPPWPPTMADAMTVDRLIRYLVARGHEVDLCCFVEDGDAERELREGLGGVCARIETVALPKLASYARTALTLPGRSPMQVQYYQRAAMRARVARLVAEREYDVVYTHLIRMAEYARDLALPKVMGVQVCQALNLGRMAEFAKDPFRKLFYRIESAKVRPYEARVCADFDRVILCGQADVDALEQTAPVPNAVVCPHGQDVPPIERVRAAVREPGAIIITGVMATYTNVDAVTWFVKEVFPRVEAAVPDAKFWIVGRNPQRAVQALATPGRIEVTGEVPDVYEWLCRAEVAVAPLRIAAGMQNKIVQAMACELPVVATPEANEGIAAKEGEQILVHRDPAAQADAIIALLGDAATRERIGRAARTYVEQNWTWEALFARLERVLEEAA